MPRSAAAQAIPRADRAPLTGLADVVASRAAGVEVGQRLCGYLPIASHLVVRPQRVADRGIRDATEHRQALHDHLDAQLVVDLVVGVTAVEGWVDATVGHGPAALREVWPEVLGGRSAPRTGHVLALGEAP